METEKQQSAVEWLVQELFNNGYFPYGVPEDLVNQAKEMEEKQLVMAANTSLKEAYEAGQKSMYCGCYLISDCSSFNDWFYETFKSE